MVKTLVVMRHGKAMQIAEDQQDFDRSLSEPGLQSLNARLPYMLGLLDTGGKPAEIWSSPALRAWQTAELLEKCLKKKRVKLGCGIVPHDCLWVQDADTFLNELGTCDADVVFAVGHNPFVEEIVQRLIGPTPNFATGGLACIAVTFEPAAEQDTPAEFDGIDACLEEVSDTSEEAFDKPEEEVIPMEPSDARLLWFAQGPESQRWKTLFNLKETLAKSARTVKQRREAFFEDPEDIETMHKFRVSIRTLRSLVAFVKPWQQADQNAETQALLKEIVGYTSRLRELDVFEEQAQANESSSAELLEFCAEEANAERERVKEALSSKRLVKNLDKALSLAKNVSWKKRYCAEGLPESAIRARFDAMADSLEGDLADLKLSDVELTHDVRKRAKRVRYAAENFKGVLGADAVDIAKGMTAHQDNLGAVCDARVNIDMISDFLSRDLPEPVAWDLSLLRAQNETFLYSALKADETM